MTFVYLLHLPYGVKPGSATHLYYLQWWCLGAAPECPKPAVRSNQRCPKMPSASAHVLHGLWGPESSHHYVSPTQGCHPLESRPRLHPQSPAQHCCRGWGRVCQQLEWDKEMILGCALDFKPLLTKRLLVVSHLFFSVVCSPPWSRAIIRTWIFLPPWLWAGD